MCTEWLIAMTSFQVGDDFQVDTAQWALYAMCIS